MLKVLLWGGGFLSVLGIIGAVVWFISHSWWWTAVIVGGVVLCVVALLIFIFAHLTVA